MNPMADKPVPNTEMYAALENKVKIECTDKYKSLFKLDSLKSENTALEHKPIKEFDRLLKEKNLREYKSEHMYTMSFKKVKLEDKFSTDSQMCSNICVKKEPPDIYNDNIMANIPPHHGDNEFKNMNKENVENIMKPDPTYWLNLYTKDEEEYINNEHIISNRFSCDKMNLLPNGEKEIKNSITNENISCSSCTPNINQINEGLNKFDSEKTDISHQRQYYLKSEDMYFEESKVPSDLNQYPDNINTLLKRAAEYSSLGDNNVALKYINLILILQPKNICALINKGAIFANEGDLLSALEIFQKAARDRPENTAAKIYYDQTLKEVAQRLTEEENYTEAIQKYQKCNFINPSDSECKEVLTQMQLKRKKMLSTLKDIKSKEIGYHSTNGENGSVIQESKKDFEEIVNTPLQFEVNDEDIITTRSEMLKELTVNASIGFETNEEDIITTRNEMLKELNESLFNDNFTHNINSYEKLDDNTNFYENCNYNTKYSETENKESYFITQNPSHRRIRLAIIGDSHALRYPHYLFSKQFDPYLLKYQPSILNLYDQYGNGAKNSQPLDKMLEVSTKPDAVIIIIGGNDVASTGETDHKILQAFIQMTETLHKHHIQPIIIPIIPRCTTIPIPSAVYNVRAYRINIALKTTLYNKLKFNPVIEYIYHMPELECDGVHLTKADYRYLTEKITDHYLKTNYRQHRKG